MVFCNTWFIEVQAFLAIVTILILIDGFLQYRTNKPSHGFLRSHNPYFNRWFSAIKLSNTNIKLNSVTILILIDGFLQYDYIKGKKTIIKGHNPYFNRWFSAITKKN